MPRKPSPPLKSASEDARKLAQLLEYTGHGESGARFEDAISLAQSAAENLTQAIEVCRTDGYYDSLREMQKLASLVRDALKGLASVEPRRIPEMARYLDLKLSLLSSMAS